MEKMNALFCQLLWAQLQSLGLFLEKEIASVALLARGRIRVAYAKWLEESLVLLVKSRYLDYDGKTCIVHDPTPVDREAVWAQWEHEKETWVHDPNLKAQVVLAEAMLRALPDILTGRIPPTDILFPDSSMRLVEGIYKENALFDYFNTVLGDIVVAYVREQLKHDAAARIHILEIGAGTGGTSATVLRKLQPYRDSIAEYAYTDLSKAFLTHAEQAYGAQNPYLTYRILNIEEPLAQQGIEPGQYDLVIAANVLHATKNIRQTLRNAKAALREHGLLLLNEMSANSLFLHLTFGLVEGWWLYEDAELRIPGCPGLAPMTWQRVLESEGFRSVYFPTYEHRELGQQIIVAESDGVVRQKREQQAQKISMPRPVRAKALHLPMVRRTLPPAVQRTQPAVIAETQNGHVALQTVSVASARTDATDQVVEDYVKETIIEKVSESLKIDRHMIGVDESFADYGLDSITGVHLVQVLNKALHIELKTIDLFDYSSVNQLALHVITEYKDVLSWESIHHKQSHADIPVAAVAPPVIESRPVHPPRPRRSLQRGVPEVAHTEKRERVQAINQKEAIAIIGMSGRFAHSKNVAELWQHLAQGDDLVEEVTRWDMASYYADPALEKTAYCNYGSFLPDIDQFDALFFNISGLEAAYMDPQQRIFLEEGWKALEDAGYAGASIQGRLCGVYAGYNGGDYPRLIVDTPPAQAMWGNAASVISARMAYHLNLQGPAITVDTACSSSLVAIHLACQGLWAHETEMAIAGGIFIQATPSFYLVANQAGMLSATGRCHTFDERADGFVPGEGVGVIVLKRLSEALTDGDHIYGVIQGTGINQDGTTNGITAPSANSQERLERYVYDTFQIHPEQIQLVEAHGTGTKLGDPIEYDALTRAFRHYTDKQQFCAIGSIKTNIGHVAAAAGIAGVMKVLLALQHRQIPPSLHFQVGNSNIEFEDSPFYVNNRLQAWEVEAQEKRRAAISSFGFSGTNAHMVIEEAPQVERKHTEKPGYIIVLSARQAEQLRVQVEQLLQACEQDPTLDCGNISYTLLLGRKHLTHRLACVVHDLNELVRLLRRWSEKSQVAQIYVSELRENEHREQNSLRQYGNQCIQNCQQAQSTRDYMEQLATIAELYVQGYNLDFAALFSQDRYSRISLPTYPFARERHWIPASQSSVPQRSVAPAGSIHPLLQQNSSDFMEQRFSSSWTGAEFFLADHVVKGRRVLPGVAYLEMARAAVERAARGMAGEHVQIRLTDIVWARPIIVGEQPVQAHIGLELQDHGVIAYTVYSEPLEPAAEPVVHSQGRAQFTAVKTRMSLDLSALKAQCGQQHLKAQQCYEIFNALGIKYGPGHQGIKELYVGAGQVLAQLALPATLATTIDQFVLHPSLLDSALQATVGLALNSPSTGARPATLKPVMPFALEEIEVVSSCTPQMWAWLRYSAGSKTGDRVEKFDIDICDEQGVICVYMKGFSTRVLEGEMQISPNNIVPAASREATLLLTPVWDVVPVARGTISPAPSARIAVVGGTPEQHGAILQYYPAVQMLHIQPGESLQSITDQVGTHGVIDHIIWMPLSHSATCLTEDAMISRQDEGVINLFRLIKALLSLGYGDRPLGWSVFTVQTQAIYQQEQVDPTHAGIHGLVGSLAKEHPTWSLRLIDLPAAEEWPLTDLFTLPYDPQGDAWVYRNHEWYRQKLLPMQCPMVGQTRYRQGGVYVVIGGAGGIGEAWSEYMIRTYQAQVVWLGRRPEDANIRGKLARLTDLGPAPCYIAADATDRQALQQAYAEIKERYGQIHGVIHSAIVLLDKSLANMDEARFRAALTAKVDVSVHLAQIFEQEALDFVLFFSGIIAFVKNAGQSNYAAGCTFEDAFAHQLARTWPCAVKTINWGYWGSVGVVASQAYQERMAEAGVGSIEPPEAMETLEMLLAGSVDQIALIKTTEPVTRN